MYVRKVIYSMDDWLKKRLLCDDVKPHIEDENWQGVYDALTGGHSVMFSDAAATFSAFLIDEIECNPVPELTKIYRKQFADVQKLTHLEITPNIKLVDSYALIESNISHVTLCSPDTILEPGAFSNCNSLKTATLPSRMKTFPSSLFYNSGLTKFIFPEDSIEVGRFMFYGCTGLTSVTLSDNIVIIRFSAFGNCRSLRTIYIPKSVEYITPEAFDGCISLTEITFEKGSKVQLDEDSLPNNRELIVKCSAQDTALIESLKALNINYKEI